MRGVEHSSMRSSIAELLWTRWLCPVQVQCVINETITVCVESFIMDIFYCRRHTVSFSGHQIDVFLIRKITLN